MRLQLVSLLDFVADSLKADNGKKLEAVAVKCNVCKHSTN